MPYDAVIDGDLHTIYNGTPEEILAWLEERRSTEKPTEEYWVRLGRSSRIMTVAEYMS